MELRRFGQAFENAIVVNTAIGGSTNAPPHLNAIARHIGVDLSIEDWQKVGYEIPLLVNCQPAGEYLGEAFHRAGGVPAVLNNAWIPKKLLEKTAHRRRRRRFGSAEIDDKHAGRRGSSMYEFCGGFVVWHQLANEFRNATTLLQTSIVDQ